MLMKTQKSIRYIDQLALFKLRGMTGINLSIRNKNAKEISHLIKQLKTISTLGYYNLKNYAFPYYVLFLIMIVSILLIKISTLIT
ncbi:hypothetical protein GCM10019995_07130 [Lactobacillus kefiranofaciens subsp. kefirgranum]